MARAGRYKKSGDDTNLGDNLAQWEAKQLEGMLDVTMFDFFLMDDEGNMKLKPPEALTDSQKRAVQELRFDKDGLPIIKLYNRTQLLTTWISLTGRKAAKDADAPPTLVFNTGGAQVAPEPEPEDAEKE